MDKHIVETFLMRIGRSYYESPEFRRQILPFEPISHFALGVMSCFMLADNVRVETRRVDERLDRGESLAVDITARGRYVVLRPLSTQREGTAVTLPLDVARDDYWGRVLGLRRRRAIQDVHRRGRGPVPDGTRLQR